MPTAVVPIMVVVDAVVVVMIVPITAIQSPTGPRITGVHIPIRPVRISSDIVSNLIANIDAVANVDIGVVAKAGTISTNDWSVDDVIIAARSVVSDARSVIANGRSIQISWQRGRPI